jgi:hypothetical protein
VAIGEEATRILFGWRSPTGPSQTFQLRITMMNKHNSFPVTAPFIIANHLMQNNQSQISENKTSYINLPTEVMHK